jgi:hypothetical protein
MPRHFIDELDDTLQLDGQLSLTGGQVSNVRANLLTANQGTLLQNMDAEVNGELRTRRGFRRFGDLKTAASAVTPQALHWFDSVTGEYLLAFADNDLFRADSSGTWTQVQAGAAATPADPIHTAQINDRFFACPANARPTVWSQANIAASTAGTNITDGPADLAFLTAQKFRLFGVNAAAIDELYTSVYLPTGATPFTSGTAISSIRIGEGEGDPITGLFAWKGFTLLVFKEGSVWAVDTTPGTMDATSATIAAGFTINRLSGRIGGVAHRSIVQAGNDVFFLSRDGVRSLAKTIGDEAGAVSEALSFPIEDYIQRINWQHAAKACACYWQGRYLLAVPLDSSTVNDHILVYRPQTQAWTVWTGIQPVQFAVSRYNGAPQKLAVLDARGQVLVWHDYVAPTSLTSTDFRDNHTGSTDSRIDWRVRTKALVWNEPLNPKQPEFIELEFTRSTALADVRIISDGDYAATLARKVNTGSPGLLLPFTLPGTLGNLTVQRKRLSMSHYAPVRELIVELTEAEQMTTAEAADSGYLSLRAIQGGAFVDTMGDDE